MFVPLLGPTQLHLQGPSRNNKAYFLISLIPWKLPKQNESFE
jgi:hypothetical protein